MVPITACYHGFLVRAPVMESATTHMVHMYTEMTLMCRVDTLLQIHMHKQHLKLRQPFSL